MFFHDHIRRILIPNIRTVSTVTLSEHNQVTRKCWPYEKLSIHYNKVWSRPKRTQRRETGICKCDESDQEAVHKERSAKFQNSDHCKSDCCGQSKHDSDDCYFRNRECYQCDTEGHSSLVWKKYDSKHRNKYISDAEMYDIFDDYWVVTVKPFLS